MRQAAGAAPPAEAVRRLRQRADCRPVRRPGSALPALRPPEHRRGRRLRHLRQHRRAEAEVRRRRVPGARHDLRRAAEGHHPPRRLEQGSGDRRQDHPRHQGAGGLLRRHPADDRERHVHHQRHRARHRVAAPPLAGRVLPLRRQDAVRRADHPVPRLVGGVRVRREEPALRPHRPEAEVPGDASSCARSACAGPTRSSGASTPSTRSTCGRTRSSGPSARASSGCARPRTSRSRSRTSTIQAGKKITNVGHRRAAQGQRRGHRDLPTPSSRAPSRRPTSSIRRPARSSSRPTRRSRRA